MLSVWLLSDDNNFLNSSGSFVVGEMLRALRVHAGQAESVWQSANLTIGLLELPEAEPMETAYAPAVSADGRFWLWMAGEAFDGGGWIEFADAIESRTLQFRQRLLETLLANGVDAIAKLDGEYQIVLWDSRERELRILNDRFGSLPLYWANSAQGVAFAGGVRGVLTAPGISAAPDTEAIREAVSFGGFRLGDRTNVAAVKMVAGASVVTVKHGSPTFRRYWHWRDIPPVAERPQLKMPELIEELHHRWQLAVKRRLAGAKRPGQTLSGGLDSRAILAEAAPQTDTWTAITYGITGCDDAKYARRAAEVVGATWLFHPLYSGKNPDWLERRTSFIQKTDGFTNLVDLMHYEAVHIQAELIDVNLHGYLGGNAIAGALYRSVVDAASLMKALPYYGTELGLNYHEAIAATEKLIQGLSGAAPHFAIFEHKNPQAIRHCLTHWRPWFRVRCPFIDYDLFDYCQGLPDKIRSVINLQERWLLELYPQVFATIPNQKTGVPILTPNWLLQAERGRRLVWKKTQPVLARLGLPARPRIRNYTADEIFWRTPEARRRIEGAILSPDSISCHVLGREKVTAVVHRWFERGAAPAQVIGAMYVFETYHRGLERRHLACA